jgi:predicted patatin/cPLA2 family phospholipase
MASSSIPFIFPPRYLDGNYYIDGGTYSNELIRPAIKYCMNKGYTRDEISIDVIICSPPIESVPNQKIKKSTIFGLGSRAYDIVSNALENHELYTDCSNNHTSYPMKIYKPYKPYPGSLLDFSHKSLSYNYNLGYNISEPSIGKYCY